MFDLQVIMTTDLITVPVTANLDSARTLMRENRIRHLPVIDEQGGVVGLLTSSDVLAATDSLLRNPDEKIRASEIPVGDVMVTEIATVKPGASLRQAALFLERHKIGCLPVVDDGKLVGIITDTDFVGVAINLLEQIEESEPVESS
ncbi:MAG TPA: CBS domain-containing protein [Xanthomonadales bacterium]|nr:CBS domain-containing protein [Xanthomonadales bacterium]